MTNNDIEIENYFKKQIINNGTKKNYCLVPTWYDGWEIHDRVIKKYSIDDISVTHYLLKWIEFQKLFLIILLYCDGFGAATNEISLRQEIKINISKEEIETILKEKFLVENGL